MLAHNKTVAKGVLGKYNLTRVEIKTTMFHDGSQYQSIDKAVLLPLPKSILFTMVKNANFVGFVNTNPYFFRNYDSISFALKVNGKQILLEGLDLGMNQEKTSVMGYRTLLEAWGIHHSNSGLQINQEMSTNGYFMLHFDFTSDLGASE